MIHSARNPPPEIGGTTVVVSVSAKKTSRGAALFSFEKFFLLLAKIVSHSTITTLVACRI